MNQRTYNNSYDKNYSYKNEMKMPNNNNFENVNYSQIKKIKNETNKIAKPYKFTKDGQKIMTNKEKIIEIDYDRDDINNIEIIDKAIKNFFKIKTSEIDKENIKLKEEENNENEDYKLKENELTY